MGGEELALIGAAIAVGIGAALLPVFVNAEVYVVTMGATVNSKPFNASSTAGSGAAEAATNR